MAQATAPVTRAFLTVQEAAAEIVGLINSSPHTPRSDEIEAIIDRTVKLTPFMSLQDVAKLPPLCEPGEPWVPPNVKEWRYALRSYHEALEAAKDDETDTAGYRASDRYFAFTEKIFPNPAKTLADVVLIAEIATDIVDGPTEPGQIYPDDDLAGFTDQTILAHLVRAVLDVIGGQNERERRVRRLELQKICDDPEAVDSGAKAADRAQ